MTEEEAALRWCPYVSLAACSNEWRNSRGEEMPKGSLACIGKKCMAWREFTLDDKTRGDSSKFGGYCGLAGKP